MPPLRTKSAPSPSRGSTHHAGLLHGTPRGLWALELCFSNHARSDLPAAVRGALQRSGPTADPVGYAEAQIQPLRGVRATEGTLQHAINQLDDSYQQDYSTNGAATKAVATASARLNDICPGAAP